MSFSEDSDGECTLEEVMVSMELESTSIHKSTDSELKIKSYRTSFSEYSDYKCATEEVMVSMAPESTSIHKSTDSEPKIKSYRTSFFKTNIKELYQIIKTMWNHYSKENVNSI